MGINFNSTVSREISGTNFTPTRAITYTYMEAELGHFLYVPAVSNVVTTGNGMGTKNVLKWKNRVLGLSLVSSLLSMALLL